MTTLEQGGATGVLGVRKTTSCGITGLQKKLLINSFFLPFLVRGSSLPSPSILWFRVGVLDRGFSCLQKLRVLVPTLLARARIIHLFSCRYQGLWELVTWFVFLRIYPETECPPISFILFKGVETGRLGFISSLSVLKFVVFEVGLKLGVLFFPLGLLEILLRFISH